MSMIRVWTPIVGSIAAGLVFGSVTVANAQGGTINGCVDNRSGALRVIAPTATCRVNETPLKWNITGPQGPQGAQGEPGPRGPSDAFNAANGNAIQLVAGDCCEGQSTTLETLSLPAGSFVVNAVVLAAPGENTVGATAQCKLRSPGVLRYGHISGSGMDPSEFGGATLPVTASITLTGPEDISVVCWKLGQGPVFGLRASMTAVQVETLLTPSIVVR